MGTVVDKVTEARNAAASNLAWSEARMAVYRDDGLAVPEPVTRLHSLAKVMLDMLPGLGATLDARDDAKRLRGMVDRLADVRMSLDRIMAEAEGAPHAIVEAMNGSVGAVQGVQARHAEGNSGTGRTMPVVQEPLPRQGNDAQGAQAPTMTLADPVPAAPPFAAGDATGKGQDATVHPTAATVAPASASSSPSPEVTASSGEGAADGSYVPADGRPWPYSGLRHGLVLRSDGGEERLFSEPIRGQWSVQTVAPDRQTAGEPFSTLPSAWSTEVWSEAPPVAFDPALPKHDAPPSKAKSAPKASAKARAEALPGMADIAPAPKKTIKDYAPDDGQFKAWKEAASRRFKKDFDEGEIRSCFVRWQIENCDAEKPNPAAAFWTHAIKALAPAPTT